MSKFNSKFGSVYIVFALLLIGSAFLKAEELAVPIDPFYIRYRKADHVLFGYFEKIEDSQRNFEAFGGLGGRSIKKGIFNIKKSWKGQREGHIEIYFHPGGPEGELDVEIAAKAAPFFRVGKKYAYIVFLRDIQGVSISQNKFGIVNLFPDNAPALDKEYASLEELSAGKKMKEVIQKLPFEDRRGFKE